MDAGKISPFLDPGRPFSGNINGSYLGTFDFGREDAHRNLLHYGEMSNSEELFLIRNCSMGPEYYGITTYSKASKTYENFFIKRSWKGRLNVSTCSNLRSVIESFTTIELQTQLHVINEDLEREEFRFQYDVKLRLVLSIGVKSDLRLEITDSRDKWINKVSGDHLNLRQNLLGKVLQKGGEAILDFINENQFDGLKETIKQKLISDYQSPTPIALSGQVSL